MAEPSNIETALTGFAGRFAAASRADAVTIREVALPTQVNLRGDAGDDGFRTAAAGVLGCDLPVESCRVARGSGTRRVLWLGPDEWLVVDEVARSELVPALEHALAGRHVSVVDVGMNRLVIELAGPRARDVLEKMCLHDLHPRVFGPGRVVGTVLFKCQVFLEQVDDRPTWHIHVRPSFSRHLASLVVDAMAEFGGTENAAA